MGTPAFSMRLFLPFLLAVGSIFCAPTTKAIAYGGIGGRPAHPDPERPRTESIFLYEVPAGERIEDAVLVVNNSDTQKTLLLYSADSTPSTDGAFACKQRSEPQVGVGGWITLSTPSVVLAPKTTTEVPFTVQLPTDVDVGEHNGCILIQEEKASDGASGVNLSVRTGMRVAVTVPGALVRELLLDQFQEVTNETGRAWQVRAQNTGTVSIDAEVRLTLQPLVGEPVVLLDGSYPVLRGQVATWNAKAPPNLFWGGWYTPEVSLGYDASQEARIGSDTDAQKTYLSRNLSTVFFFPNPRALAVYGMGLCLLIFAVVAGYYFVHRRRWIAKTWKPTRVSSVDSLESLAKRHGVSWKKIANINRLKAPYALSTGQVLLLPPKR